MIYHFKTYMIGIWLGTFRYNCTWGQLNNKGRGGLDETKQSRDKTEIEKEIIYYRVNKYFEVTRAWDCFTTWKVICIMHIYWNVFQ